MSLDATRWAWTKTGLRPIHKLVLLSLADRASADDKAFATCDHIVADTGADRKTVLDGLKVLRDFGLISAIGELNEGKNKIWKLHCRTDKDASI